MTSKKKKNFNSLFTGIIPGIIVPLIAVYLFYLLKNFSMDFNHFLKYLFEYKLAAKVLSVALIANLSIFFLFLQTDRYKSARGVISATFLYAIIAVLYIFVF